MDAPVSGGTSGAADGSLSIMVSGAPQAYETVSGILRVIGRNLFYLGEEPGQGQLMKVINNTICAAATLASFEGLVLGSRAASTRASCSTSSMSPAGATSPPK